MTFSISEKMTSMSSEQNASKFNFLSGVRYEHLVLHPEKLLREILQFLDLPWNERVLHHETAVNQENGISLSKSEKSTDQVVKPVYKESLSKWVGHIPDDVVADMARIAPEANPPDYEKVVLLFWWM